MKCAHGGIRLAPYELHTYPCKMQGMVFEVLNPSLSDRWLFGCRNWKHPSDTWGEAKLIQCYRESWPKISLSSFRAIWAQMSPPGIEPQTPCTIGRYSRKEPSKQLILLSIRSTIYADKSPHYLGDFLPTTWLPPVYVWCSDQCWHMTDIYWLQAFRGQYFMT